MPDYKNGKIYTIRCNSNTDFIYIGSTCQTLSRRWQDHKKDVNHRDSKVYEIIRENGGIHNFLLNYMKILVVNEKNNYYNVKEKL